MSITEMLVSLVLKNISAEDSAALETAIAEKLSGETAALVKRRDDLGAPGPPQQRVKLVGVRDVPAKSTRQSLNLAAWSAHRR